MCRERAIGAWPSPSTGATPTRRCRARILEGPARRGADWTSSRSPTSVVGGASRRRVAAASPPPSTTSSPRCRRCAGRPASGGRRGRRRCTASRLVGLRLDEGRRVAEARERRLAAHLRDVPRQRVRLEDVQVVAAAHAAEDHHVRAERRRRVARARRRQRAGTGLSHVRLPTSACARVERDRLVTAGEDVRCIPMSTIEWLVQLPRRRRLGAAVRLRGDRRRTAHRLVGVRRRRRRASTSTCGGRRTAAWRRSAPPRRTSPSWRSSSAWHLPSSTVIPVLVVRADQLGALLVSDALVLVVLHRRGVRCRGAI